MRQILSSNMKAWKTLFIILMLGPGVPVLRSQDNAKQSNAVNECEPKMSQSDCDRKIQRDLASAISANAKSCSFEPDWRPTHIKDSILHVSKVTDTRILAVIDGQNYVLQADDSRNSDCREVTGRDCSQWKPETGMNYPTVIVNNPKYFNNCLHKDLPARREVCVSFSRKKQGALPLASPTPQSLRLAIAFRQLIEWGR